MKNILIIANDFTTIHHFRMELLEAMLRMKWKVTLALPDDKRNEVIEKTGVNVRPISLSRFGTNPLQDIRTMIECRRLIRELHPEFVLTYTAKPNIYGGLAASLEKVPYAVTVTGLGLNFDKGNLISKIMLYLQKLAFRKAQKVFFQNSRNMEMLQSHGIAISNAELIPGSGVNLTSNAFEDYPQHDRVSFLSIARIRHDKGYDELFEVIRKCRQQNIPADFHIIGWYEDEHYKPVVEELQKDFDVHFYEYVPHDEMHSYIANCDCLIQPSHHEGMSNVILEAAATGRPCIVSDIPGCREGVIDNESGFLFKVKDAADLYYKTILFVNTDRSTRAHMGTCARSHMEKVFDRENVVELYINQIEQNS